MVGGLIGINVIRLCHQIKEADNMGFAKKLVQYRKAVGMTQEGLAEKCDVTRQAVAKWEKGESLPDVYMIAKLAGMFNVAIEELIYSRDAVILENRNYYLRIIEEADKEAFCRLMREHRYFGVLLKMIDKIDNKSDVDEMYWNEYLNEEKTYVICSKKNDEFAGYIYMEAIDTSAPQMTMQFDKQKRLGPEDFALIRDFFNWINKEYHVRAIQAFVNSDWERELFSYIGYENVQDEVMLALPV